MWHTFLESTRPYGKMMLSWLLTSSDGPIFWFSDFLIFWFSESLERARSDGMLKSQIWNGP